jgi:hypothetical protein
MVQGVENLSHLKRHNRVVGVAIGVVLDEEVPGLLVPILCRKPEMSLYQPYSSRLCIGFAETI